MLVLLFCSARMGTGPLEYLLVILEGNGRAYLPLPHADATTLSKAVLASTR